MKNKKAIHVKIGDKVQVISGNQKGIIGKIQAIFPKQSIVYIDTIPTRIRSLKKRNEGDKDKVEIQIPIHISNVMLWDTQVNSPSRIGWKFVENGKRRYFKKSGNLIEINK